MHSSVSGLWITKLDVLDGIELIRVCAGYRVGGEVLAEPPLEPGGLRGTGAGVRGAAGLMRLDGRGHAVLGSAAQRTPVPRAARGTGVRADRYHLDRVGS